MPLIQSPLTDMLVEHCWHEQPDGTWSRDGKPPVSTSEAIAIEEREEQARTLLLLRDPKRGTGKTAHQVAHFDAETGERVGSVQHATTEAERLYEVNGQMVGGDGRLVRLPRNVRR